MKRLFLFFIIFSFAACSSSTSKKQHKIDPGALTLNYNAGKLVLGFEKDRLDSALVLLDSAIKIEPGFLAAYSNKTEIYVRQGKLYKALETARQLEKIDPQNPQAIFGVGLLLEKTGKITNAKEYYQKALVLYEDELNHSRSDEKKYRTIQVNYAYALIFANRKEDAKKELNAILKKDSSYFPAKLLLSSSREKLLAGIMETGPKNYSIKPSAVQPKFPGGRPAFIAFLKSHIHYPSMAKKNNVEGPVILSFNVERDGSLTNVRSLRDPGDGLAQEAIRVVSLSPKWSPGFQNNHPVRVAYTMPVIFNLPDNKN